MSRHSSCVPQVLRRGHSTFDLTHPLVQEPLASPSCLRSYDNRRSLFRVTPSRDRRNSLEIRPIHVSLQRGGYLVGPVLYPGSPAPRSRSFHENFGLRTSPLSIDRARRIAPFRRGVSATQARGCLVLTSPDDSPQSPRCPSPNEDSAR